MTCSFLSVFLSDCVNSSVDSIRLLRLFFEVQCLDISQAHKKAVREHKKATRTPEQIERLKAKSKARRERKFAAKKEARKLKKQRKWQEKLEAEKAEIKSNGKFNCIIVLW